MTERMVTQYKPGSKWFNAMGGGLRVEGTK